METNKIETKKEEGHGASKTPLALQIIAILLGLWGIGYILIGIPLLLILGFGLIPMAIGAAALLYATRIWRMKKNAYMGSMVIGILSAVLEMRSHRYISLIAALAFLYAIYTYRDQFVN